MAKLNELTLKELKAKAVKLGMPEEGLAGFNSKAPLIATIKVLQDKDEEKLKKVKTLNPPETPAEKKSVAQRWLTKAMIMRDKLDGQEKVSILIPLEPNEKPGVLKEVTANGRTEYVHVSGAIETVTLNGYKTIIPKGTYFKVPKQVAEVIENSYQQTREAGKEYLLDRNDPKTGGQVRDAL